MIQVTIGESKPQEVKPFPKLMIHEDGSIFHFVRSGYGLPLTGKWAFHYYDLANWSTMDGFTDYNEPITIQNK